MNHDARSSARKRKKQYEELGRFIEAFEDMVNEVRTYCIEFLSPDNQYTKWAAVPFYHDSMTAAPLFAIFRTMIAQMLNDTEFCKMYRISEDDRALLVGVMIPIAEEFENLCRRRNDLLHGTWDIGDLMRDASTFSIKRYKLTKAGLTKKDGYGHLDIYCLQNVPKDRRADSEA